MLQLVDAAVIMNVYARVCNRDEDMRSWDADFKNITKQVLGKVLTNTTTGTPIDIVIEVTSQVFNLGQKILDSVLKEITGEMSMKMKELHALFLRDYIKFNSKIQSFCSDLEVFLQSARDRHSYIDDTIQQCINMESEMGLQDFRKIAEKLRTLKASLAHDYCTEILLKKVEHLFQEQEQIFASVRAEVDKLEKDRALTLYWRKVTDKISMSIAVALLLGTVVTACIAPPAVAIALAAGTLAACAAGTWLCNIYEAYDQAFLAQQNAINSITSREGNLVWMELEDIKLLIDRIEKEINALLVSVDLATGGNIGYAMKDMKAKLDRFLKKIEELEVKAEECSLMVKKERENIRKTLESVSN